MRFLLGLILGLLVIPVWALLYFHFGHPPVAVADQSLPMERDIVHVPMHARIDKEMPASAPIEASATNLTAKISVKGGTHSYTAAQTIGGTNLATPTDFISALWECVKLCSTWRLALENVPM